MILLFLKQPRPHVTGTGKKTGECTHGGRRRTIELTRRRESKLPAPHQATVRTACGSGRVCISSSCRSRPTPTRRGLPRLTLLITKRFHPLLHRIVDLREKRT